MSTLTFWLLIGFLGQVFFTSRFVVQWLVSERQRTSRRACSLLVAKLDGWYSAFGLRGFSAGSSNHCRPSNGSSRLCAEFDASQ